MTGSKNKKVATVAEEMLLSQAIMPIPQANQRGEQEQTMPVC